MEGIETVSRGQEGDREVDGRRVDGVTTWVNMLVLAILDRVLIPLLSLINK